VRVIYPGVDPWFFPREQAEVDRVRSRYGLEEEYVLYVGSNRPHKNVPRLVDAWSIFNRWSPFSRERRVLALAGFGDRKGIAPRSDAGRVRYLGPIEESDLPGLYAGAAVFIFPSLYEGFGLPPLEAMACGAPVACSKAASLPEVVGSAAVTFDPENVCEIAAVIGLMLEDESFRRAIRRRGLQQAGRFTWEDTARKTLQLYREVLDSRQPGGSSTRGIPPR
jgi:alpha-1,3-rhamnosyl/mannosyltransferase